MANSRHIMYCKVSTIIVTALLIITMISATLPASLGIGVVDTINVGVFPFGPVYDSGKGEIFVHGPYNQTFVISDSTNQVVDTFGGSGEIMSMAYDSGMGEIFQSIWQSQLYPESGGASLNAVYILSDTTNSLVASIPIGSYAGPIVYDSSKGEIFVATGDYQASPSSLLPQGPGTSNYYLLVISDSSNSVVSKIPLQYSPSDLVYDSGKGEIFASNGDSVTVISDSNNSVVTNITNVGPDAMMLAYDQAKGEIFVTNNGANTVSVISDDTNTVVATVTVGYYPLGIAYDSGKGELYVTNPNTVHGDSSISVISDSNNTVIATLPNVVPYPTGIAYDSAKGELFIANSLNDAADQIFAHSIYVISDSPNLTAPSISASSTSINQGQTSNLISSITTGAPPYTYQWLIKPPNQTAFLPIDNATLPNYDFTTLLSTNMGNYTLLLKVTDATGTTVNSTSTIITVKAPLPNASLPTQNLTALAATVTGTALVVIIALTLLLFRKYRKTVLVKKS